ncbi:MAG: single-stranded-DNA-specific exonuclease RecJ [Oscillospiraceae bacterium]
MNRKKWIVSAVDKDLAAQLAESYELDPFLSLLFVSRGITDDNINDFLFDEEELSNPFLFIDMEKAVERIKTAIEGFQKITVFGDYDADGVTSTALLYLYLESEGANVECYIPDRVSEGYGITKEAIKKISEEGTELIITVDNGISAIEEIDYANELGVDVVITDHHKAGEKIPNAIAVVDPQRSDCPSEFKERAGVGIVLKLICAISGENSDDILENFADLVAVGTLADIVPLVGENRQIVKKGLEIINKSPRIGIEALKNISGNAGKTITASGVSYTLAPRINAAGRMGSAMTALKLLLSDDFDAAAQMASEIDIMNKQRQTVENDITKEAMAKILGNDEIRYADVIVVAGEGWHQGVIGIVASRISSFFGKPAVVISIDGDSGKGSCRSIEGFSIYDALSDVHEYLKNFGGHTLAAGLGIETDKIDDFRTAINNYAKTVEVPFPSVKIDCKLNPSYISLELLNTLSVLEPFGSGNPQPVFGLFSMMLTCIKPVGEGKHLRLTFKKGTSEITAMLFSVSLENFKYNITDIVDVAVKIEKNEFRGEIRPSIQIKEMRFSGTDEENYLKSERLYAKYKRGDELNKSEIKFITPSREFLSSVYKFIKFNNGWNFGEEAFCIRAKCPLKNVATVLTSFDILTELSLINKTDEGRYEFIELPKGEKVDLDSSKILIELKRKGE